MAARSQTVTLVALLVSAAAGWSIDASHRRPAACAGARAPRLRCAPARLMDGDLEPPTEEELALKELRRAEKELKKARERAEKIAGKERKAAEKAAAKLQLLQPANETSALELPPPNVNATEGDASGEKKNATKALTPNKIVEKIAEVQGGMDPVEPYPLTGMVALWSWPWLVNFALRRLVRFGILDAAAPIFTQLLVLQTVCGRLLVAAFCGAIIGVERKDADRPAGLRSMTLVSCGSALYVLACMYSPSIGGRGDPARAAAQVCTGVGFIGAGVIAKGNARDPVRGVTTACAVWVSAAIGVTAASGLSLFALYATGLSVTVLRVSRWYNALVASRLRSIFHLPGDLLPDAAGGLWRTSYSGKPATDPAEVTNALMEDS